MLSYIESWLSNPTVTRFKVDGNTIYGIRVLGRGENLFFQENDKGLICQIDAIDSIIYANSVKNWEGEKKMNKAEKDRVLNLIEYYYKKVINENVSISY